MLPADLQLTRLAERVVERERRAGRPVESVRIQCFRVEYSPATLVANSHLLREFTYAVPPAAAPRP